MTEDTIKVESVLPRNIHDAIRLICHAFDYDANEFILDIIKREISAEIGNQFQD